MRVNILGAPELIGVDRPVPVSPQLWCVLLSLVLTPGIPIQLETLVDRLWPDDPSAKARPTARSYLRRVERLLSEAAGCEIHAVRRGRGYALDIPWQDVDLHLFRDLRKQAEARADRGELAEAVTLMRQAQSLWRGEALVGLPGEWIGGMRARFNEELRRMLGRRIELELALGRHAELLDELAELTARYRTDDMFTEQRMLALFRSGRHADALHVHQEMKDRLAEEGLELSPRLEKLYVRILRHDSGLLITRPESPGARGPAPDTLPQDDGDFIGRADEAARLLTTSDRRPTVKVIEGMGGIGKTALAIHAARSAAGRYPDGQLYLNLRAHDLELGPLRPADALHDLLTMLGVKQTGDTLAERRQHWRDELGDRRVVLVLDDAEGPDQVAPLLADDADCLVLVTSRRHADWGTSGVLSLGVLREDDAVALFRRVAGRAREQAGAAVRLCGGLPLAIKLAAIRLRSGTAEDIDDLLRELRELNLGDRPPDDVAAELHSAFDLSYRRLEPDLRRFFRYLGVSPSREISPQAAAAVTGVTVERARVSLVALTEWYLLEEEPSERFCLHDLIRSYARARSRAEDSEVDIGNSIRRLADYYMQEAGRAGEMLRAAGQGRGMGADPKAGELPSVAGSERSAAQAWLRSEYENVLRVAECCGRLGRMHWCVSLVRSVSDFLETSGRWEHAVRAYETEFRASQDTGDPHGMATAAYSLSLMCLRTGRPRDALAYANEAAGLCQQIGDREGRAAATDRMGVIFRHTSHFRAALAHHQEAIDLFRAVGNDSGMAYAMLHAASALYMLGRPTEEMAYLTEALGIFRQQGELRGQAIVLNSIGIVHLARGYYRHAMRNYQESYAIFRTIDGRQNLAMLDQNMAEVLQYRGQFAEALAMYRKALTEFRAIGDLRGQALVLIDIGSAYQDGERYSDAIAHHERALVLADKVGDRHARGLALCGIADARRESGDLGAALTCYDRAARIATEIEAPFLEARVLHGMAETVLRTRGAESARIYWRQAHDIYSQIDAYQAEIVAVRLQVFDQQVA